MNELNIQNGLTSEIRLGGIYSLDWDYQHQRDCELAVLEKAFQKKQKEKKDEKRDS